MVEWTIATLCSGGEGVGVGARMAGLTHLWGIEYDPDIAAVARANGFNVLTADVTQVDPAGFDVPDILHVSPPCPSFSVAKTGGEETAEDVVIAEAVCRFIDVLRPRVVTVENVYGYRHSESWATIATALHECGYAFNYWHLCTADYGAPQTRRRMVVIARRDGVTPMCPVATHAPAEDIAPMFDDRLPWVGWYEAIEDLIPTLPDSEFAPWQLARLPGELLETVLMSQGISRDQNGNEYGVPRRSTNEPVATITANNNQPGIRAYIVSNAATERTDGIVDGDDPALAVTSQSNGRLRAFICGTNANDTSNADVWQEEQEPVQTLRADGGGRVLRAFVVHPTDQRSMPISERGDPVFTITAGAFGDSRPCSWAPRAAVAGRVVKMTPRCLARFQSFPDWYEFSGSNSLDCRIIGNAVPPLLYRAIAESVKGV